MKICFWNLPFIPESHKTAKAFAASDPNWFFVHIATVHFICVKISSVESREASKIEVSDVLGWILRSLEHLRVTVPPLLPTWT